MVRLGSATMWISAKRGRYGCEPPSPPAAHRLITSRPTQLEAKMRAPVRAFGMRYQLQFAIPARVALLLPIAGANPASKTPVTEADQRAPTVANKAYKPGRAGMVAAETKEGYDAFYAPPAPQQQPMPGDV